MSTILLRPEATITVAGVSAPLESGTITVDEVWSPYCQASLVVPFSDPAAVARIDPRQNHRATVAASVDGYWRTGGDGFPYGHGPYGHGPYGGSYPPEWIRTGLRTFDLGIRVRTIDYKSGTCVLQLASDEALLQDYVVLADDTSYTPETSLRVVINHVLGVVIPGAQLEGEPADDTIISNPEPLIWKTGVSAWAFLEPLLTQSNLRLFCDEARKWRLVTPADYMVPGTVFLNGTVATEGIDEISREDVALWAEGIAVQYAWDDSTLGPQVKWDTAGQPNKVLTIEYRRAYPGPGAAANILASMQARGRVQAGTALTDYQATPGMQSQIKLDSPTVLTGRVAAVTFDLATGLMNIRSKDQIQGRKAPG